MNYYQILGLPQDATTDQIKQRYKILIKTFHPDLYDGDKTYANEKTKEITEAYKILVNPQTRNDYDMLLYNEVLESNSNYEYNYTNNHSENINEFNNYKDDKFFKQTTQKYKHTFFDFVDNTYDNFTTKSIDFILKANSKIKILFAISIFLFLVIFFLLQIRKLQESYLQNQQDKINNSYNSQYDSYNLEIPQSILNAITEEDLQREFGEDILNQVDDGTFNTVDELKKFYYLYSETS